MRSMSPHKLTSCIKALARALYLRASVLVLDDIFRGLDTATAEDVHSRLFGPKGVLRKSSATVVFATHSGMSFSTCFPGCT